MKKLFFAVFTCLSLASLSACGGGGGVTQPETKPLYHITEEIYKLNTERIGIFEYEPSIGLYNNPDADYRQTAFVSRYVGLTKTYAVSNQGVDSTIDTTLFPLYEINGAGPQRVLQKVFDDTRLFTAQGCLQFEIGAAIPFFNGTGVGQLTTGGYISDVNNSTFAMIVSIWDNRFSNYEPFVMHDYNVKFASSPMRNTKYVTDVYSDAMQSSPFTEYKTFKFTIKKSNIDSMVKDLNQFTTQDIASVKFDGNVSGYKLNLGMVLHEVFLLNRDDIVNNSVSIKSFKINRILYEKDNSDCAL